MPRDERKHQKALMKKRNKQKAASQRKSHSQEFTSLSLQGIIRHARTFPLVECLISESWQSDAPLPELIQILLARQQPDGNICFGTYLVDNYCLGLKNTFANAGFSRTRYEKEVRDPMSRRSTMVECTAELAHQMIYGSIEYAAQFGFTPQKDFALSQYVLAPRGELEEPYHLTFGKDGKPFFVAGPYDNAALILRQLEKNPGPGNFTYFAPLDVF